MTVTTLTNAEDRIASWALGTEGGKSSLACAELYWTLSADGPGFSLGRILASLDAERTAWARDAFGLLCAGQWTGRHRAAIAAAYPTLVEHHSALNDANRTIRRQIEAA
ncbi:hypothetical protein QWZ14_16735 [Paeniroseomonas aquatica]|uniref:Uncharacterized protein n=1 Tax=Paeniroseomonas aquatica TaxID=373043 RepID=A0ABT8A883_9PROT|nr:hypothetical protein [Paeniroseomonas aquatica]MDN3566017.1 hypothetical protein [Paeniroseomonas aquatica]